MQWRVHVLAGRRETLIPLLLDKIRKERRTTSLSDNFLVNAEQKVKEMLQSQGSGSIEELGMSKETRNSAKDIERFKVVKAESPLDISLLSMVTLQADQFLVSELQNYSKWLQHCVHVQYPFNSFILVILKSLISFNFSLASKFDQRW
tara:strand:+ start:1704 stop:2147 length:444 start_codon:yes stop_codon:yes gene_type:complete